MRSPTLKQHIKQDLKALVFSGQDSSDRLTLERLAEHYHVSTTPVREAVSELVSEGVLRRDSNGRLALGHVQTAAKVEVPPVPESPVADLTRDLVQLSLKGEALLLREQATAEKYGVSRSVIRQAFHQLAGDGLLEHLPRRGWQLRPFSQDNLDAYIEVRVVLERKALDLAKHRLVEEDLRQMLDSNLLPREAGQRPQIDDRLHSYLIEKAGNPYIADFFARHHKYFEVIFDWEALDWDAALQTVKQHRSILNNLIARDWKAAGDCLEHHIRHNHPVLKCLLQGYATAVEATDMSGRNDSGPPRTPIGKSGSENP